MAVRTKTRKEYIGSCCGNSFIIFDCRGDKLSRRSKSDYARKRIHDHGVDSALFLEKSMHADVLLNIFEKDGTESDACGNGTLLISHLLGASILKVEMRSTIAVVSRKAEKQRMHVQLDDSHVISANAKKRVFHIKCGEPHIVCWLDDARICDLKRRSHHLQGRYPEGVNVNVIHAIDNHRYYIRTYERGVCAETKSCGTGSLSSCLAVCHLQSSLNGKTLEFQSRGGSHWVTKDRGGLILEALIQNIQVEMVSL